MPEDASRPPNSSPSVRSRRRVWRLRIVVGAIVVAIVGAAMAGWLIARTSSPPTGPVILISIDALRADHLAAYGYRHIKTPNIDALAADGVVFERAYSHAPLTLPEHVSILSGRLPFETGVRDDDAYQALPPKMPLLPQVLHRRGFKTAGIVSSPLLRGETGLASAFDFYDDEMPEAMPGAGAAARRDGARTAEIARHWVDQQTNRFFLFLHLDEPRTPCTPPERFARYSPYDGAIAYADETLGHFIEYLKQRELYDPAIIVLLSDHGESLGDHGETQHGLFLYDSTQHTPLVVKLPKQEGAGGRRSDVVQHIDVMPTILDLMGAPRPSGLRGRSLRHLLDSRDATLPGARVYAETVYPRVHFGWSALASLTAGNYRFIKAPRPELYDLTQDRGEKDNLAAANAARSTELAADLDKYLAAVPPAAASVLTDEDRLALARLSAEGTSAGHGDKGPGKTGSREGKAPEGTPGKAGSGEAVAGAAQADPTSSVEATPPDPKDGVALVEKLRRARALASERRFPDAIAAYREITAADEGMRDAWDELGTLLLAAGQPREALAAFRQLMRANVEDAPAMLGAARCLVKLGKLDDAETYATLAAKLSPVAAGDLLVRIELRQKDYPAARRAAEAVAQTDRTSPLVPFVEGVELYNAGKYDEASPRLESAAQLAAVRPEPTPDVFFYDGDTLAHLRRYADAENRLAEELKWFPENVRARESLASIYQATGRSAEIGTVVNDLLRWSPTPDGYAAASRLSALAGDKGAATKFRAESRKLFGDQPPGRMTEAPRQ